MYQFRRRPTCSHYTEHCQRCIPEYEKTAELKSGSVLHEVLAAENDEHVNAAVVEDPRPVLDHPAPGLLVDEVILEVEHVRVVGRDFHTHLGGLAAGGSCRFLSVAVVLGTVVADGKLTPDPFSLRSAAPVRCETLA